MSDREFPEGAALFDYLFLLLSFRLVRIAVFPRERETKRFYVFLAPLLLLFFV